MSAPSDERGLASATAGAEPDAVAQSDASALDGADARAGERGGDDRTATASPAGAVEDGAASASASAQAASGPDEDARAAGPVLMLPSAAAWHSSTAIAWARDPVQPEISYLAYASKNVVRLVCPTTRAPLGTLIGHANRVSSICLFAGQAEGSRVLYCASGAADRSVRLWNVRTRSLVSSHAAHKVEATCVSASPCSSRGLVVSGDKEGKLVIWRFTDGQPKDGMVLIEGAGISCVLCSPFNENEVAVGFTSGVVAIVDLVQRAIVKKMQHHDEVLSLTWAPPFVGEHVQSEAPASNPNQLLASSSRDKTIRIWDTNIGKLVTMLSVPKPSRPLTDAQKARIWISCVWCPYDRNLLVSSSQAGDLLAWDLGSERPAASKFANGHPRSIFAIAFSPSRPVGCVTVSLDRQIGMWDVPSRSLQWMLPGLGGYVYSLDFSPASTPPCVAVGSGEGTVRLWYQNNPSDPYKTVLIWNGIQASKVTAVAWHPSKRGLLALGTDEGHVGFVDTTSGGQSAKCTMMKTRHRGTVYELAWQPSSSTESKLAIFSCGADGLLCMWNPERPEEKPLDIGSLISTQLEEASIKSKVTEFTLSLSGHELGIGFDDGSVVAFLVNSSNDSIHPGFRLQCKTKPHSQLVNRMRWGPKPEDHLLASASDDGTVVVSSITMEEFCQVLKISHLMPVSGLAWSPCGIYIASGSFDGTSQVWNVTDSSPVSLLRGHESRIFAVSWHATDSNLVFTGSEDQTVRMWNITQHPYNKNLTGKKKTKPKPAAASSPEPKPTALSLAEDGSVEVKHTDKQAAPSPIEDKPESAKQGGSSSGTAKPKKPRSLLPLNATALSSGQATNKEEPEESSSSKASVARNIASLLEGGKELDAMFDEEIQNHCGKGTFDAAATLEMWREHPGAALSIMADSGNLTPSWLALAPLAGPEVWRVLMHARATHLEEQGDIHQAALYYLASEDCISAVQCYRKAEMYREAIALGRTRGTDPLILRDLYAEWAVVLELQGNKLLAERCKRAADAFGEGSPPTS